MDFVFEHYDKILLGLGAAGAILFLLRFVAKFTKNKVDDVVVELSDKLLEAISKKLTEEKAKRDAAKNG